MLGFRCGGEWCVAVPFFRSGAKRSLRLPHVVPPLWKKTKAGREPRSFVFGTYRSSLISSEPMWEYVKVFMAEGFCQCPRT